VKTLAELKKDGKITSTTHIVYFGPALEKDVIEISTAAGLTLINFEEAIAEGLTYKNIELDKVTPETYYTFSYTSGTTGMPKGVMLTHRNFVSNCAGLTRFDGTFKIRDDDVYFSYLPLAHVFERCILLVAVVYKMQIGFY
jgi:long-chain acyl-CoA synthetase